MGSKGKIRNTYPPNKEDLRSKGPGNSTKRVEKYDSDVIIVHKNRRKVKETGCMEEMNHEISN